MAPEGEIELGTRVGIPGGANVMRPRLTLDDPLTAEELARFEALVGKPGTWGRDAAPDAGLAALVVEDDPETRRLLCAILKSLGFEAVECPDGADALKALASRRFPLLVLDLRLPSLDGYRVLRGARSYLQIMDMTIFVITGLSDPRDEIAALNLGADRFLRKPFGYEQMAAHLKPIARRLSAFLASRDAR